MAEAKDILLALGFSETEITKDDLVIDDVVDAFRAKQKELFKNDPDFVKPIQDAERAKVQSMFERKAKQTFELSAEEIKEKSFEEMLAIAKEKVSKKSNTGNDEIQKELIEANRKIKQFEEEVLPAEKARVDDAIRQYQIKDKLTKKIASLPLSIDAEGAMLIIESDLGKNYKVELNSNGDLEILTKDGNKVMDEKKLNILSVENILDFTASKYKIKKESNAGEAPATPKTPIASNTGATSASTYTNPHIAAARAAAEEKKAKATQAA